MLAVVSGGVTLVTGVVVVDPWLEDIVLVVPSLEGMVVATDVDDTDKVLQYPNTSASFRNLLVILSLVLIVTSDNPNSPEMSAVDVSPFASIITNVNVFVESCKI